MKPKVFLEIAIRIIILFGMGMIMSFIPPYLHDFFGDIKSTSSWGTMIDDGYNWGVRHYWYFWCMFFLFILALANTIMSIVKILKNKNQ